MFATQPRPLSRSQQQPSQPAPHYYGGGAATATAVAAVAVAAHTSTLRSTTTPHYQQHTQHAQTAWMPPTHPFVPAAAKTHLSSAAAAAAAAAHNVPIHTTSVLAPAPHASIAAYMPVPIQNGSVLAAQTARPASSSSASPFSYSSSSSSSSSTSASSSSPMTARPNSTSRPSNPAFQVIPSHPHYTATIPFSSSQPYHGGETVSPANMYIPQPPQPRASQVAHSQSARPASAVVLSPRAQIKPPHGHPFPFQFHASSSSSSAAAAAAASSSSSASSSAAPLSGPSYVGPSPTMVPTDSGDILSWVSSLSSWEEARMAEIRRKNAEIREKNKQIFLAEKRQKNRIHRPMKPPLPPLNRATFRQYMANTQPLLSPSIAGHKASRITQWQEDLLRKKIPIPTEHRT